MLFQPLKKNLLGYFFLSICRNIFTADLGVDALTSRCLYPEPPPTADAPSVTCQADLSAPAFATVPILPTLELAFWNCTNLNFQTNNSEENSVFYLRLNLKLIANLCQWKVDHLDTAPKLQFQVSPMTPIRMSRICNTRTGERLSTTWQAHRGLFKH